MEKEFLAVTKKNTVAFFVTSAINVPVESSGFGVVEKRSFFSNEERFRQTQMTIANIRLLFPESKIYLVDAGVNVDSIKQNLNYVSNIEIVDIEKLDFASAALCRTNPSKGLCEAVLTNLFLRHYSQELNQYDYIVKMTGRYFFTRIDSEMFNEQNKNLYLMKKIEKFPWKDEWNYPVNLYDNGLLYWAPTQTYVIGSGQLNNFIMDMGHLENYYFANPGAARVLDFECMFYFCILKNKPFIEVPMVTGGWTGQLGQYTEF